MAFQIPRIFSGIKIPNVFGFPSRWRGGVRETDTELVSSRLGRSLKSRDAPCRVSVARAFSTGSKSFKVGSHRAPSQGNAGLFGWFRRSFYAVLGYFGASFAALHSCGSVAMSARPDEPNLDSSDSDWTRAKNTLLSMDRLERQKLYRTDFLPLEEVPVWTPPSGGCSETVLFKSNEALAQKISLFRGDITKLEIGAIVNAANKTLMGGGGVDGAIHRTAGPLLKKECSTLGGCETGEAKITGAYGLPAKYVIHTVGPIAHGSVGEQERSQLRRCYYNCLETAEKNQVRSVAFPCISTGVYGYPPDQAVDVALQTVREFLDEHHTQFERIIFCVFLKSDEELYHKRLPCFFPQAPKSKL